LLYLVVSLLAVAVVFYTLGAPFIAALEVIIYAGRDHGAVCICDHDAQSRRGTNPKDVSLREWRLWIGPSILAAVLSAELVYLFGAFSLRLRRAKHGGTRAVGVILLGPYALGVELASMLLLAALVAREPSRPPRPARRGNQRGRKGELG